MAGGEGTRLRPVNQGIPKPMVRLLGRPVMEHIVELLKKHDILDICVTLRYLSEHITAYFGDGTPFGVRMEYRVETEPLGTAGSVKACMDFIGNDDFLIISGDAACDFDLNRLIAEHKNSKRPVTMALYPQTEPLEYGLVLTAPDGAVISFIEKPDWERVVTDLVNTGIYIISPHIMRLVPSGRPFDFARDLFPLLLKKNLGIHGAVMQGYWCDIGSPEAYHRCSVDALLGKLKIKTHYNQLASGIWCSRKLPSGAELRPPCLVGEAVQIGEGAVIGPCAVIGSCSRIGALTEIKNTVVDGAQIGSGCRIDGAVICRNAVVSNDSQINPGGVIAAEGALYPPERKKTGGPATRKPYSHKTEISCSNRAGLMRFLSESLVEFGADFTDGLLIKSGYGNVRVSPASDRSAVIIETDSKDSTLAADIAAKSADYAKRMGRLTPAQPNDI